MIRVPLTQGQYTLIDDDEAWRFSLMPEARGVNCLGFRALAWSRARPGDSMLGKWHAIRNPKTGKFYAARSVRVRDQDGRPWHKIILLHREIAGALRRGEQILHLDGDTLNNQKSNLQNQQQRLAIPPPILAGLEKPPVYLR